MIAEQELNLSVWENAAQHRDEHVSHHKLHLSFSSPSERVIELTQEVHRLREYLAESCALIRQLQSIVRD